MMRYGIFICFLMCTHLFSLEEDFAKEKLHPSGLIFSTTTQDCYAKRVEKLVVKPISMNVLINNYPYTYEFNDLVFFVERYGDVEMIGSVKSEGGVINLSNVLLFDDDELKATLGVVIKNVAEDRVISTQSHFLRTTNLKLSSFGEGFLEIQELERKMLGVSLPYPSGFYQIENDNLNWEFNGRNLFARIQKFSMEAIDDSHENLKKVVYLSVRDENDRALVSFSRKGGSYDFSAVPLPNQKYTLDVYIEGDRGTLEGFSGDIEKIRPDARGDVDFYLDYHPARGYILKNALFDAISPLAEEVFDEDQVLSDGDVFIDVSDFSDEED